MISGNATMANIASATAAHFPRTTSDPPAKHTVRNTATKSGATASCRVRYASPNSPPTIRYLPTEGLSSASSTAYIPQKSSATYTASDNTRNDKFTSSGENIANPAATNPVVRLYKRDAMPNTASGTSDWKISATIRPAHS